MTCLLCCWFLCNFCRLFLCALPPYMCSALVARVITPQTFHGRPTLLFIAFPTLTLSWAAVQRCHFVCLEYSIIFIWRPASPPVLLSRGRIHVLYVRTTTMYVYSHDTFTFRFPFDVYLFYFQPHNCHQYPNQYQKLLGSVR